MRLWTSLVAYVISTIISIAGSSGLFSRYKTAFSPNTIPPQHVEQVQTDTKWLEKKKKKKKR